MDGIKKTAKLTPLLPCPHMMITSLLTPLQAASIIAQVSTLFSLSSLICCQIFPPQLKSFPSISSILLCSQSDSLAGSPHPRVISLPCILRLLPYSQTEVKRSQSSISQARFIHSLSPPRQPPTSLISGDQKGIYWDHLSTEGMACEVLIDHLVVCTLSHTELESHKQPLQALRYEALQELTGLSLFLSTDTQECEQ